MDVVERLVDEECVIYEDMIWKEQPAILADRIWNRLDLERVGSGPDLGEKLEDLGSKLGCYLNG